MRFAAILTTTVAAFGGLSSAIISGISVPATIKPGDGFNFRINTANYIQSVSDIAVAIGVAPGKGFQGALGQIIDSFYLGPEKSNIVTPIVKWIQTPSTLGKGNVTLTATFYSCYGAASAPTLVTYTVPIALGDVTSTTYVTSKP
ncbi:hypothetical protein Dda_7883 [Drechslerella dactyloides]|uniref:Uncharacterized protein n=1 Tax=Drechslerella dactyloides TaxID=74499 RepID=A0AAD6IR44_DREDA|nr:hypothetical protein Dda_7883 [Drechslerella dactyloides]